VIEGRLKTAQSHKSCTCRARQAVRVIYLVQCVLKIHLPTLFVVDCQVSCQILILQRSEIKRQATLQRVRLTDTRSAIYRVSGKSPYTCLLNLFIHLFHHSRILWMQQTPSRSAQSSMHRHVLCDVFRAVCDVKEAKAPVMAVRNSALLVLAQWRSATLSFVIPHTLLSARVKSGLRGGHDSGEGGRCNTTTNPLAWERFIQEYTQSFALRADSFPNRWRTGVLTRIVVWPVLSFYAPKHSLPTRLNRITARNCHQLRTTYNT
jgi:hypothetical protein